MPPRIVAEKNEFAYDAMGQIIARGAEAQSAGRLDAHLLRVCVIRDVRAFAASPHFALPGSKSIPRAFGRTAGGGGW